MPHTDRMNSASGGRNQPGSASGHGGDLPAMADHAGGDMPMVEGLEKYLAHLAHFDLPLAVKIELIAALQAIMQNFVDRAFGDDPVQQVGKLSGRAEGNLDAEDAGDDLPMVDLIPTIPTETDNDLTGAFRNHAGRGGRRK